MSETRRAEDAPNVRAMSLEPTPKHGSVDYGDLDLRDAGAIGRDLAARAAAEASQPVINLSGPFDADARSPAFFTPAMLGWYQQFVASPRWAALSAVRRRFEAEPLKGGNRGFLLEAATDEAEARKQKHLSGERERFFQSKAIRDLMNDIERLRAEYEYKRARYGRDAKAHRPVLVWTAVLAVMGLEYPLNLSAFLRINFMTPAFATASVTILALMLAFSSHAVGKIFKQWNERVGTNVTTAVKRDTWRELAKGLVLLLIGGAAVVFSRSFLLQQLGMLDDALGTESRSHISTYGLAYVFNVAVYLIGVFIVWQTTDPVPGFAEERARLEKLEGRLRREYKSGLERQQQQRIEEARRDVEQLRRQDADQSKALPNYGAHRDAFERIRETDVRVAALLNEYRARLVTESRRAGLRTRFQYDDLASGGVSTAREVDADAYLKLKLHLGYA